MTDILGGSGMRDFLKALAYGVAWLIVAPLGYLVRWAAPMDATDQLFRSGSQTVSLIPGVMGVILRRAYYAIVLHEAGEGLTVEFGAIFARRGTSIGDNVYIGAFCTIGLCHLRDDVLLGSGVDIVSGKRVHLFERADVPIRLQGGELQKISIGPDAWLGNRAVVMARVDSGCVVGAGSVVTAPCKADGIYVGNPATRLRDRLPNRPPRTDDDPSPANHSSISS